MTFKAIPPENLQLQIQKRTPQGDNSNYVIIRLHYPVPNSIQVAVNNVVQKPIALTDYSGGNSGVLSNLNTSQCGSNIYNYKNSTITFVLTEAADCLAVVSLVDSITLTTHFAIDINSFFSNNSTLTNFINNLCALLDITDTSRVKVVGVFSGSTKIDVVIDATNTPSPNTASNGALTSDRSSITGLDTKLQEKLSDNSFNNLMATNVAPVTFVKSSLNYIRPNDDSESTSANMGLIVGLSVGSIVLLLALICGLTMIFRKKARVA